MFMLGEKLIADFMVVVICFLIALSIFNGAERRQLDQDSVQYSVSWWQFHQHSENLCQTSFILVFPTATMHTHDEISQEQEYLFNMHVCKH